MIIIVVPVQVKRVFWQYVSLFDESGSGCI
jgi:hypothetical protein